MSDADARELHAEVLALQAVLMSVFRRMVRDRPELAPLFDRAFDEADTILAGVAVQENLQHSLGTMTGALKIIDELRGAVVGRARAEPAAR